MKKLLLSAVFALLASGLLFVACHHEDEEEDDGLAPELSISAPLEGASITGEVHITGLATDVVALHTLTIKVVKDSDGSELFSAKPAAHDEVSVTIEEKFTPAGLVVETPVTLTAVATDHGENSTTKTVHFKVKS